MKNWYIWPVLAVVILLIIAGVAMNRSGEAGDLIEIDGSSTVYPITEAVAEDFGAVNTTNVTVGVSGTGGGFKKFCRGETVISDASRPIKPEEMAVCEENGIEFIELPVAFDGIAVVVNPENAWVDNLTTAELKKLWEPAAEGKVSRWSDIRADWPNQEVHLFGPGVDSGTFDYFTDAIVGEEGASRGDFTASEDDNVLVAGVAADELSLGFFGVAYYEENQDKLKLAAVNGVEPTYEAVASGEYQPLSRPIFIYVSKQAAQERPEVSDFVEFYLTQAADLAQEVGYIALPGNSYDLASRKFAELRTGTAFGGGSQVGVKIEDLL